MRDEMIGIRRRIIKVSVEEYFWGNETTATIEEGGWGWR